MRLDGGICEQEGHHPLGLRLTYSGILITLKTANAKILCLEHKEEYICKSGVTIRDIRLAILIERQFEKAYQVARRTPFQSGTCGTIDIDLDALRLDMLTVERREFARRLEAMKESSEPAKITE